MQCGIGANLLTLVSAEVWSTSESCGAANVTLQQHLEESRATVASPRPSRRRHQVWCVIFCFVFVMTYLYLQLQTLSNKVLEVALCLTTFEVVRHPGGRGVWRRGPGRRRHCQDQGSSQCRTQGRSSPGQFESGAFLVTLWSRNNCSTHEQRVTPSCRPVRDHLDHVSVWSPWPGRWWGMDLSGFPSNQEVLTRAVAKPTSLYNNI